MASKPMLRSLKVLRENDWQCAVVERWKPVFDKKTRQLGLVFLHGWGKQGPRGKRKTWTLKEEVL